MPKRGRPGETGQTGRIGPNAITRMAEGLPALSGQDGTLMPAASASGGQQGPADRSNSAIRLPKLACKSKWSSPGWARIRSTTLR